METSLVHLLAAVLAIPSQPIDSVSRANLLENNPDGIGESYRVVWSIWGQKEDLSFFDGDVSEMAFIDGLQKHVAFVHVEPFRGFVDVIVSPLVRAADDLKDVRRDPFNVRKIFLP